MDLPGNDHRGRQRWCCIWQDECAPEVGQRSLDLGWLLIGGPAGLQNSDRRGHGLLLLLTHRLDHREVLCMNLGLALASYPALQRLGRHVLALLSSCLDLSRSGNLVRL